jgi:polyisoprenoid-binding protein YceI
VESLSFLLPVRNLKGDIEAMDADAYTALKADRHKEIAFRLTSARVLVRDGARYEVAASGHLSVAGVTRLVALEMHACAEPDGSIVFTGSQVLRMSDYNVDRPSLLFGAIRAANEMTLRYHLVFRN